MHFEHLKQSSPKSYFQNTPDFRVLWYVAYFYAKLHKIFSKNCTRRLMVERCASDLRSPGCERQWLFGVLQAKRRQQILHAWDQPERPIDEALPVYIKIRGTPNQQHDAALHGVQKMRSFC